MIWYSALMRAVMLWTSSFSSEIFRRSAVGGAHRYPIWCARENFGTITRNVSAVGADMVES